MVVESFSFGHIQVFVFAGLLAAMRALGAACAGGASPRSTSRELALALDDVLRLLPGPASVQKLTRLDDVILSPPLRNEYANLLGRVVRTLLPKWPDFEEVSALFTVEESFAISHEILINLCGFLKEERNSIVLEALAYITLKYAKCDAILVSIIDCSSLVMSDNNRYVLQNEWETYVQLLATVPERVANALKTKTPKEYSHENYSYYLIFHMIRCIDFMSECSFHQGTQYDLSYLSHLMSKFITNYSLSNTQGVHKLIDVLIAWTDPENTDQYRFVRRKLIQTLLNRLNRQAIDKLALLLLKRSPIDYKIKDQPIRNVLGNNIDTNKDWHDILTFRIPFYVHPKDFRDTTVEENLVYYISTSKNSVQMLTDLVYKLCRTWSDVHLNNVANIDHHMHTSILLILAVKYRIVIWRTRQNTWDLSELKKILYKGMSKHLDVISQEFRCVGMATIEILFKMLVEVDDSDKKAVDCLNFDFEELGQQCIDIYNTLQATTRKCLLDDKDKIPNVDVRQIDLNETLDEIAVKVHSGQVEKPVQNTIMTCAVKGPQQTKEIVKTIISAKLDALGKGNRDEDLDSDDDLQPYDMSNDVPVATKKKPKYLRDLIEIINEAKDQESFEIALTAAEDLVNRQLKTEDPKLAVELLEIFVHLEEKFHVENFSAIKLNTSVLIVCSHPKVSAEYLCKEIHSDIGRYSIATKIFMLDVLTEAAEKIADVKTDVEEKPVKKPEPISKEAAREEALRKRLLKKTKYFHSKRPHHLSKAKKNLFAAVSDHFFYPLISGFGYRQLTLSYHNTRQDIDNLLLLRYLSAVGTLILASKNCPKCPIYCREILQMVLYLRFSPNPSIQMAVISVVASIAIALPESLLKGEYYDVMMELTSWLVDTLTSLELTDRLGGPHSEPAQFATEILALLEKLLGD